MLNIEQERRCGVELVGPVGLAGVGLLHAAWALGWRWPGGSDEEWALRVADSTELPPRAATWMMVAILLGGSGVVAASTSRALPPGPARRAIRFAAGLGSALLVGRSLAFLPQDIGADEPRIFHKLDLAVYAPLSATLGVCIAAGLRRSARTAATRKG